MACVLVIDDDKMVCELFLLLIRSMGHEVTCALRLKEGLKRVSEKGYDIVFLDVNLPDGNGLNAIPKIKKAPLFPEVVIITGEGSPSSAELAVKSGAWDYIQKPLAVEKIKLPLLRVLQFREEKIRTITPVVLKRDGVVGNSYQMAQCLDLVARASVVDATVLITGDTGTGKELFARAVHENSSRQGNAFVVVDCAALPDNLIESTLFGHEKGAFTGADRNRQGLITEADGGTLFLDEVGELPLQQQSTFLRVLQERKLRPVGSEKDIGSDFRLIVATNRDLDRMVEAGTFREDLLFRLRSIVINLPPLRNRTQDIREIFSYYLEKFCNKYGMGKKGYSPEFLEALITYSWPGNVRELIHAIENALSEARYDPILFPVHLPTSVRSQLAKLSVKRKNPDGPFSGEEKKTVDQVPKLKDMIETVEKNYFQDLISLTRGDIQEICRLSGLTQSNVYLRFKKYGLSKPSS